MLIYHLSAYIGIHERLIGFTGAGMFLVGTLILKTRSVPFEKAASLGGGFASGLLIYYMLLEVVQKQPPNWDEAWEKIAESILFSVTSGTMAVIVVLILLRLHQGIKAEYERGGHPQQSAPFLVLAGIVSVVNVSRALVIFVRAYLENVHISLDSMPLKILFWSAVLALLIGATWCCMQVFRIIKELDDLAPDLVQPVNEAQYGPFIVTLVEIALFTLAFAAVSHGISFLTALL